MIFGTTHGPPRSRRCAYVGTAALIALLALGAAWARGRALEARLLRADPDTILDQPDLRRAALVSGRAAFMQHCAGCHGRAGRGGGGAPDLTDRDWLYGQGRVAEIEPILRYGIRSRASKGWNLASMPAYASLHPYAAEPLPPLAPREVDDLVQLLLFDEGRPAAPQAVARGRAVYTKAGCWDCHGTDAYGDSAIGAPDLRDRTTLYGGSPAALRQSVEQGRRGVSPAFAGRLSPAEIRALAVYTASLARPSGNEAS